MKIFVVFDPLYERVISAHKTEKGAGDRCFNLNDKETRVVHYLFEYDEYELED